MSEGRKIFAILAGNDAPLLRAKISDLFADESIVVGPGQWFISAPTTKTTQEISNTLGITNGETTADGIVLSVGAYFGRAPADVWEWMTAKLGDSNGAAAGR